MKEVQFEFKKKAKLSNSLTPLFVRVPPSSQVMTSSSPVDTSVDGLSSALDTAISSSQVNGSLNDDNTNFLPLTLALSLLSPPSEVDNSSSSSSSLSSTLPPSSASTVASNFGTFLLPILFHCRAQSPHSPLSRNGAALSKRSGLFSKSLLIQVSKALCLNTSAIGPGGAGSSPTTSIPPGGQASGEKTLHFRGKLISAFNASLSPSSGFDKEHGIMDCTNWFIEVLKVDEGWKRRKMEEMSSPARKIGREGEGEGDGDGREGEEQPELTPSSTSPLPSPSKSGSTSLEVDSKQLPPLNTGGYTPRVAPPDFSPSIDDPTLSPERGGIPGAYIRPSSQSLIDQKPDLYISINCLPLVHALFQVSSMDLPLQAFIDMCHQSSEENGTMNLNDEVYDDVVDIGVIRIFLFNFFFGVERESVKIIA